MAIFAAILHSSNSLHHFMSCLHIWEKQYGAVNNLHVGNGNMKVGNKTWKGVIWKKDLSNLYPSGIQLDLMFVLAAICP